MPVPKASSDGQRRGVIEALPNPIEAIAYLAAFSMIELVSAVLQELPGNPERLHRCPTYYVEVFFSFP